MGAEAGLKLNLSTVFSTQKELEFQLVLWASSSHILLAWPGQPLATCLS